MERRHNKRVANFGVIESYSFQGDNRDVTIKRPKVISLRDISVGGLGITSSKAIEIGATLSLDLEVDNENYVVIGKIVWCRPGSDDHYECGMKLIYMPEDLSDMVEAFEEMGQQTYMN